MSGRDNLVINGIEQVLGQLALKLWMIWSYRPKDQLADRQETAN